MLGQNVFCPMSSQRFALSMCFLFRFAQNPLHTFPRNFSVDWEAANWLLAGYGLVVYVADLFCGLAMCAETGVMDFGLYKSTS